MEGWRANLENFKSSLAMSSLFTDHVVTAKRLLYCKEVVLLQRGCVTAKRLSYCKEVGLLQRGWVTAKRLGYYKEVV